MFIFFLAYYKAYNFNIYKSPVVSGLKAWTYFRVRLERKKLQGLTKPRLMIRVQDVYLGYLLQLLLSLSGKQVIGFSVFAPLKWIFFSFLIEVNVVYPSSARLL